MHLPQEFQSDQQLTHHPSGTDVDVIKTQSIRNLLNIFNKTEFELAPIRSTANITQMLMQ